MMDDSTERAMFDGIATEEQSGGVEASACENDAVQEPYEGMSFDSEESARSFYGEYAKRTGFITRILSSRKSERDGSLITRGLGCNCRPNKQKQGEVQTSATDRRRDGCTAMFLVKRDKLGTWVVRKFVKDHNHPVMPSCQMSRPPPDEKDRKIQELTAELRIKKRLTAAYKEQLLTFMKDVENYDENLTTKVQRVIGNLKQLEAKRQELASSS